MTKKELFRYGIKSDSDCLYRGEPDSINHNFMSCEFTKTFTQQVVNWFNAQNESSLLRAMQQVVLGNFQKSANQMVVTKFYCLLLFMKYYVYTSKLNQNSLTLSEFINEIKINYGIETEVN